MDRTTRARAQHPATKNQPNKIQRQLKHFSFVSELDFAFGELKLNIGCIVYQLSGYKGKNKILQFYEYNVRVYNSNSYYL